MNVNRLNEVLLKIDSNFNFAQHSIHKCRSEGTKMHLIYQIEYKMFQLLTNTKHFHKN